MISIVDFFFPHACAACKQISGDRRLFCSTCTEMVELLDYRGRCGKCFRKRSGAVCKGCRGELFERKAAVFEYGGSTGALLSDPERFGKTLAAFFVIQLFRLKWTLPEAIYFPKRLKQTGRWVRKFLGLPVFSGHESVLLLSSRYDDDEVPHELYFSKLFFLGFTIYD